MSNSTIPTTSTIDARREFEERMQQASPPEWVLQMLDHYRKTGAYRAQDLKRLLGDPNERVEFGSQFSLSSHFSR